VEEMCAIFGCWSLFILVIVGILIAIVIGVAYELDRDSKLKKPLDEMRSIFAAARKGEITKSDADKFFECADRAMTIIPKVTAKDSELSLIKEEIEKMSTQISTILAIRFPATPVGEEIDKLASLRQKGMISDFEFQAFSERFKLSTGEKASDIIKAISNLYEQHQKGAMTEGNFHAGLWSLLDKLDRKA
jgi:type III secretory pathway component EscV